MKILVFESDTIAYVIDVLIKTFDPDYPKTDSVGPSNSVERELAELLSAAISFTNGVDMDTLKSHENYALIQLILNDQPLMRVIELNWMHVRVEDGNGTMVLIF